MSIEVPAAFGADAPKTSHDIQPMAAAWLETALTVLFGGHRCIDIGGQWRARHQAKQEEQQRGDDPEHEQHLAEPL